MKYLLNLVNLVNLLNHLLKWEGQLDQQKTYHLLDMGQLLPIG